MNTDLRIALRNCIDTGAALEAAMALELLNCPVAEVPEILAAANAVRLRNFGHTVKLCSIVNGKSGRCGEDCRFCAQSAHYHGAAQVYPFLSEEKLLEAYDEATQVPIRIFSVVTSGGALDEAGLAQLRAVMAKRPNGQVRWCASLGCLDRQQLEELRRGGLTRYHHNLETSRSFYPQVCTTHDYQIRVDTVKAAKAVGLEVCSGGIFGLGESLAQRVEMALELAYLQVDEIPLNFLIPIPGTPLEKQPPMPPMEILKTIAMFRLTNPRAGVRICAGRVHMNHLQSMIFAAGCNSMMIGALLTTAGGKVEDDLQMLRNLELEILQG